MYLGEFDPGDMYPILKDSYVKLTDGISDSLILPLATVSCSLQHEFHINEESKALIDYITKSTALKELINTIEDKQNMIKELEKDTDSKYLIGMLLDIQLSIDILIECSKVMVDELEENAKNDKIKDNIHKEIISNDYFNYRLSYIRLNKDFLVIRDDKGNRVDVTKKLLKVLIENSFNNKDNKEDNEDK